MSGFVRLPQGRRVARSSSRFGFRRLGSALAIVLALAAPGHAAGVPPLHLDIPLAKQPGKSSLILAGGCFWGMQAVFQHVKGVDEVTAGYTGGNGSNAQYDIVSTGTTGHAESVKIVYDPSKITLGTLLKVFFFVAHDPTELDRQGPDKGPQYRSEIFYDNSAQQRVAADYIGVINKSGVFDDPVVTKLAPATRFYRAESYHQDYVQRHPDRAYVIYNDIPKLLRLQRLFPDLYRDDK